jgi:ABC-type nitrate/sulfonate/bicarbonate transport system ATPase subunit
VVVVEVQAGGPAVDESAEVPEELELLKGINAFAEPGSLLALMGGSGAGKTTLMDVIAGRKTVGRITGDILVNGRPKQQSSWARMVGVVALRIVESWVFVIDSREAKQQSSWAQQVGALRALQQLC